MNENGYKVMHIEDGVDSKYGNIHIIMANPVQNNGFENTNSHIMIHRHVSFFKDEYDENLNSGHDVCLIPNMGYKIQTLNQQFYRGNWFESYYSFRSYVESLAEGDDVQNFWGWLFDRPDFNRCMPWNLPSNYEQEYNRFLDACENTDNTEF